MANEQSKAAWLKKVEKVLLGRCIVQVDFLTHSELKANGWSRFPFREARRNAGGGATGYAVAVTQLRLVIPAGRLSRRGRFPLARTPSPLKCLFLLRPLPCKTRRIERGGKTPFALRKKT